MSAPDPITPAPRRLSIRLLRPLGIVVAAAALVVVAGGVTPRHERAPTRGCAKPEAPQ
jgi:hypothetical protein